jgi:hypothetical protein
MYRFDLAAMRARELFREHPQTALQDTRQTGWN